MTMWKCGNCGYIHEGDEAPDTCPKCGAPKEKFEKLEDDAEELIMKARITNDIHMDMRILLAQIEELAMEGIDEDLDPACVAIFEKVKDDAHVSAQKIKAELETHMKKNKWG